VIRLTPVVFFQNSTLKRRETCENTKILLLAIIMAVKIPSTAYRVVPGVVRAHGTSALVATTLK
jgi:hypothetical protein